MLENDINRTEAELERAFPWFSTLSETRKDVMIDICFNMGLTKLRKFKKALDAMDNKDYNQAAIDFLDSRWARQVKKRANRLCNMLIADSYDVD
jgi:lysozyme